MTGIIYAYTCKVNGKMYIGKTVNPKDRHRVHIAGKSRSAHFNAAVRKYGADAFAYEVLVADVPAEDLNAWERFFVWHLQSYGHGYNLTPGGDGMDAETARKQAKDPAWQARNLAGVKERSERGEWAQRNAEAARRRGKDPKWRAEMSEAAAARAKTEKWKASHAVVVEASKLKTRRAVVCVDTGAFFESLKEASKSTGLGVSAISNAVVGMVKRSGGFRWRYATQEEIATWKAKKEQEGT
jgi:group I intron endonuclease